MEGIGDKQVVVALLSEDLGQAPTEGVVREAFRATLVDRLVCESTEGPIAAALAALTAGCGGGDSGSDSVEATGTERPGDDPSDQVVFIIDDDICTRCALCVDRCPTGVIILGTAGAPAATGDSPTRTHSHGHAYGMRF